MDKRSDNAPAPWGRPAKMLASALVAFHLAAVFVAPLAFATRRSPAVEPLRVALFPYIQAMFLDHGYAFFAPDPGPNHLVEYELTYADDRPSTKGRFPNLQEQQPRLLYHRYFMLSESLNTYYAPLSEPRLPPDMPPTERENELNAWRERRADYEALRGSLARHLAAEYEAESAELHRIRHEFLNWRQFTRDRDLSAPTKPDDPRTYIDLDAAPTPRSYFGPVLTPLPGGNR